MKPSVKELVHEFWKLYFMIKPPFKLHIFSKKKIYTKYEFYGQALRIYLNAIGYQKNCRGDIPRNFLAEIIKHSQELMKEVVVNLNSQETPSEDDRHFIIRKVNAMWHAFDVWGKLTRTKIL